MRYTVRKGMTNYNIGKKSMLSQLIVEWYPVKAETIMQGTGLLRMAVVDQIPKFIIVHEIIKIRKDF